MDRLVMYRGGGYSGCVWEWNAAFLHGEEFHSIHHSGSKGCDTREKLDRVLAEEDPDIYEYPREWERFLTEFGAHMVMGVFQRLSEWVGEGTLEIEEPYIQCDKCAGLITDPEELRPQNPRGSGGIEMEYGAAWCQECESEATCQSCNEVSTDEDVWKPITLSFTLIPPSQVGRPALRTEMGGDVGFHVCEYCAAEAMRQAKANEQEDTDCKIACLWEPEGPPEEIWIPEEVGTTIEHNMECGTLWD